MEYPNFMSYDLFTLPASGCLLVLLRDRTNCLKSETESGESLQN